MPSGTRRERRMFMLKRTIITFLVTAVTMLIGIAYAADHPAYLDDDITYYLEDNQDNTDLKVLMLPAQSLNFEYSFANQNIQFSDFVIVPSIGVTPIKIEYTSSSDAHSFLLEVIKEGGNETIYKEILYPISNPQYFYVDFSLLQQGYGYYIKLSNPSSSNATGTLTISAENTPLTRGQFSYSLAQILLEKNVLAKNDGINFSDVDKSNVYFNEINYLSKLGIVFGDGNGQFRAEDKILCQEAAAMIARVFFTDEDILNDYGAYPYGYIDAASKKLLPNVELKADSYITPQIAEVLFEKVKVAF